MRFNRLSGYKAGSKATRDRESRTYATYNQSGFRSTQVDFKYYLARFDFNEKLQQVKSRANCHTTQKKRVVIASVVHRQALTPISNSIVVGLECGSIAYKDTGRDQKQSTIARAVHSRPITSLSFAPHRYGIA